MAIRKNGGFLDNRASRLIRYRRCTPHAPVPLWPLLLYFGLVIVLVIGMLGVSAVLGERHHERATDAPYEGGIVSEGSARVRLSARFYLIAMFFVIFDLESVFLFAWAVAARELGWTAYAEALTFTLVLVAALVYLWRVGALDWSPSSRGQV